ncbi:hypothetical protein I4F81_008373 [Pyropia yezoensis]|uniref:Uncharacterized protein n=1 Tax=Pyropia yezoensis TaxID=2788 RepID=A0ACC3C792_PYRYE|nr:hypothetical protein I4F81_008373 [Neopyropia yezoensis]
MTPAGAAKSRDALLDILLTRAARDAAAYTRAAAAAALGAAAAAVALPRSALPRVVGVLGGRLADRAAAVRRAAAAALEAVVAHNPYGPALGVGGLRRAAGGALPLPALQRLAAYYAGALPFAEALAVALPRAAALLVTPATTDVAAGAALLITATQFGVAPPAAAPAALLPLLASPSPPVVAAGVAAFARLLGGGARAGGGGGGGTAHARGVVGGLAAATADGDPRVAAAARALFRRLEAKAPGAVYNLLPEALSALSVGGGGGGAAARGGGGVALDERRFRLVMAFLLGLVASDRHAEAVQQ